MAPPSPPALSPPLPLPLPLLLLALALVLALPPPARAQRFVDVSRHARIDHSMGPKKKYGGAAIADLNNDGFPDLLLGHHDRWFAELYINNRDGTFRKHPFSYWVDLHAITPFRPSPYMRDLCFSLAPGGSAGTKPAHPVVYRYHARSGRVEDVTTAAGLHRKGGRGRSAVYMDLSNRRDKRFPDVVFTNAAVIPGFEPRQYGYENIGRGKFRKRYLKGFAHTTNTYATVADVDNDGQVELLSYQNLSIHRVVAPFTFSDITFKVLPPGLPTFGVVAIAELDYDNDGDFDLYIARTNTGDLQWLSSRRSQSDFHDILLENRNGKYVDVSLKARIPRDAQSRGVTTADFNNDGHIDILVTKYYSRDVLLLNRGDGTFRRTYSVPKRRGRARGDMAQAVDYDGDGRVDVVMSEGDQHVERYGGYYRILRNVLTPSTRRRYILVRVGNAPGRGATSLHAVVSVVGSAGLRMMRRVGSPGVAVSSSLLEVVHFGIGWRPRVRVTVRWTNGKRRTQRVSHGATARFGAF